MKIIDKFKLIYWKLPISMELKNKIRGLFPRNKDVIESTKIASIKQYNCDEYPKYIEHVLNTPVYRSEEYINFREHKQITNKRAKVVAYYLTQYHPTEKNNLWWGKGTTEWTNVTKSVPQFAGHIQPKLPGELGFYDLRLPENMQAQINLAKNYGVDVFSFYFYWFNGERALERPLDIFMNHKEMDIEYCICWCNENWTKRYSGISSEVLLKIDNTEENYKRFIDDAIPYMNDDRYFTIDNKLVLVIYRPSQVPNHKETLQYWRTRVKERLGKDLYIIASLEARIETDWVSYGFDAMSQFQPGSITSKLTDITSSIKTMRDDFKGTIYDYNEIIEKKPYKIEAKKSKVYPAVMPAWDNTPRRNQHGIIYYGSRPVLYKKWLRDAINYVNSNDHLEENVVFINAWNEWGEGAYLEPDREYGYAYLEATYQCNLPDGEANSSI